MMSCVLRYSRSTQNAVLGKTQSDVLRNASSKLCTFQCVWKRGRNRTKTVFCLSPPGYLGRHRSYQSGKMTKCAHQDTSGNFFCVVWPVSGELKNIKKIDFFNLVKIKQKKGEKVGLTARNH